MNYKMISGPLAFVLLSICLQYIFPMNASIALATTAWMGLWWVFRPVSITITVFLPIAINAVFNIAPMPHIINPYFSEIVILLLGSDLISMTWAKTGLDKRLSQSFIIHWAFIKTANIRLAYGFNNFIHIFAECRCVWNIDPDSCIYASLCWRTINS